MAEYIEKEAFIDRYRKLLCEDCDRRKGMKNGKMRFCYEIGEAPCRACSVDDMLSYVDDFPSADVQPVRHGRWTDKRTIEHDGEWYCSVCNKEITIYMGPDRPDRYRYCPNCGAMMEENDG